MPTYTYETIPEKQGECAVRFEVKQSMTESPLEVHPETGQPVKRVISGGFGYIRKSDSPPMGSRQRQSVAQGTGRSAARSLRYRFPIETARPATATWL